MGLGMLDKWKNDIYTAIKDCKPGTDEEKTLVESDGLLANKILFLLMKSPVWTHEFSGVELRVSKEVPSYSYVHLPDLIDPDEDGRELREETSINTIGWKYSNSYGYYDDERELWAEPKGDEYVTLSTSIANDEKVKNILNVLRNDEYYDFLLEEDSQKIQENIEKLQEIDYVIIDADDDDRTKILEDMMHMSEYEIGHYRSVFGHRYASHLDNRKLIVAKNFLGPVGILSLFDRGAVFANERIDGMYSISFVSVAPSYRNMGIAKELMRRAFKYCQDNEKIVMRTSPSKLGELFSYDSFTRLAKSEFKQLPVLTHNQECLTYLLRKFPVYSRLNYTSKCKILSSLIEKADELLKADPSPFRDYSYLDEKELYFHIENIMSKSSAVSQYSELTK